MMAREFALERIERFIGIGQGGVTEGVADNAVGGMMTVLQNAIVRLKDPTDSLPMKEAVSLYECAKNFGADALAHKIYTEGGFIPIRLSKGETEQSFFRINQNVNPTLQAVNTIIAAFLASHLWIQNSFSLHLQNSQLVRNSQLARLQNSSFESSSLESSSE
jgi:hypothetical protein